MSYNRDEPPDHPEPPECCGDIMDVSDDGVCSCPVCGRVIEPSPDIEPPDDPKDIEGDYLRDEMQDREPDTYDYDDT